VTYENAAVGRVCIGALWYQELINLKKKNPILAGFCREQHEKELEPRILTKETSAELLKQLKYPKSLPEKADYLITFMYNHGGADGKTFNLQSGADYPLCYADSPSGFNSVMTYLIEKGLITCKVTHLSGLIFAYRTHLKPHVIDELRTHPSHGPMQNLVDQEIRTGNAEWDKRINHAIELFDEQPQTKERMRSAVVDLCAVLEPLRSKLEGRFGRKDTNTFFTIVNEFDVRHNKKEILVVEHEEQLEWLYYSFLNTINTYAKLERKLSGVLNANPA